MNFVQLDQCHCVQSPMKICQCKILKKKNEQSNVNFEFVSVNWQTANRRSSIIWGSFVKLLCLKLDYLKAPPLSIRIVFCCSDKRKPRRNELWIRLQFECPTKIYDFLQNLLPYFEFLWPQTHFNIYVFIVCVRKFVK